MNSGNNTTTTAGQGGGSGQGGKLVLGIDLGANSLGWAIIRTDPGGGEAHTLGGAGVRIFDAGVEGTADDIAAGRDEARGAKRRDARARRRLLQRRSMRLHGLAEELQKAGLLPPGDISTPAARKEYFDALDRSLADGAPDPALLPYRLRARALDNRLHPHQAGRAIHHLAQRRGYKSNRKDEAIEDKKKKDDAGKVKDGINSLTAEMLAAGARTLGEYFSTLDPHTARIRKRYTARHMYEHEFDMIWTAQQTHAPETFTEDARKRIHHAIFFQRPLKSQKHLIGKCELEPRRRRAPMATLDAQRFRLLQTVNNLKLSHDTRTGEILDTPLTPEQRAALIKHLETTGEVKFSSIRTLLKLPKTVKFNLEAGGNDKIPGNRTAAKLTKIFGPEKWSALTPAQKDAIVHDLLCTQKDEALQRRGIKWGLGAEAARAFSKCTLEDTRCSLSEPALKRIIPHLENGKPYATARLEEYGIKPEKDPLELLPPLHRADIPELRNPSVARALSELRKIVNAIIREHGRPDEIRIELARDLRKSRKQREAASKKNRANEKARAAAKAKLLSEAGIQNPSRGDIEKWLLYEECNQLCPYTGKPISPADLFGPMPLFDIEHIIPFSRSFDNSFLNKTLCCSAENRSTKRNRTPFESYAASDKWDTMLARVEKFRGDCRDEKLKRFKMRDLEDIDGFASRQLNDTRYASRLAVRYLGALYGAGADGISGRRRVIQPGRGQITSYLRDVWDLNSILGDGGAKNRGDHRAHAIDAVCIALTTPAIVKMMSDAAERAPYERRRRFAPVPAPWPGFDQDIRNTIENITVSHRVSRRANSALHEESHYSKPKTDPGGKPCRHIRKNLASLKPGQIDNIVDPAVRELVRQKLETLGGDMKKLEHDPPCLTAKKDGRRIPIIKVRIRVPGGSVETVAPGTPRERHIMPGANHHMEIFEIEAKGKKKWEGRIVTMLEAARRVNNKQPIVDREPGKDFPGAKFVFSLAGGEILELDDEKTGKRGLFIIRTISTMTQKDRKYPCVAFVRINDARKKEEIIKEKDWNSKLLDPLRKMNCRKVSITPLGEVIPAND